jgi:AmmeMemoRadiSam system protein B/AmmeMemoRadiSam system protein A
MESTAPTVMSDPAPRPRRPELTAAQKQLILEAAGEMVSAIAENRQARFADPTLGGATDEPVAGAFVSLKRGKHLRACCGGLQAQVVPLGRAIYEAAVRTAREDSRFPPLSPIELDNLDLEVWLLFAPEPVQARGEERALAVQTGGKHGLVIERGPNRGLLLPGVAAEHDWDSRRFLEQTCVKAGIHPVLWKDDATAVMTFEGEPIRGRLARAPDMAADRPPALLRPDELAGLVAFCRDNLAALLTGATPNYYAFGLPDGTVSGIVLTLRRPGRPSRLKLSQLSLRPGLPLQTTLFTLAEAAAQVLVQEGTGAGQLNGVELGLTVLNDPAMHGTVADPHLDYLGPRPRALLVIERARSGIAFDPARSADDLLAGAARRAGVLTPAAAGVFSLEALSTETRLGVANGQRPEPGPVVRPAGVAGQFYPDDPAQLAALIDDLLPAERQAEAWPAALVPHAGLRFSGPVGAQVFRRLAIPPTVIVLGPKHTPLGVDWAVTPHETWALPGFNVAADVDLARRLADAIPGLALDALAHRQEHAVEVELPFIARIAPRAKVIGIAIGHGDLDSCRRFADGLATVLGACDPMPLLLISSDMNHFATDDENRRLDELALAALERLDPEEVYETVTDNHISMCGILPAVIVLETLKRLGGLTAAERVAYATSADVTGDKTRVVGYAGLLFR